MELYKLGPNFVEDDEIDNYQSLIWSERYVLGDFQLKSYDIAATRKALPEGTVVTLRDSLVPMIVEDQIISKPARDKPYVTIVGSSYESVLGRRASVNALNTTGVRAPWNIPARSQSDAAHLVISKVLGTPDQKRGGIVIVPASSPAVSPLDAFPGIRLTLPSDFSSELVLAAWSSGTTYSTGAQVKYKNRAWIAKAASTNQAPDAANSVYWTDNGPYGDFLIPPKNLLDTVVELINANHHGLKAVRPLGSDTQVALEIYNGADLRDDIVIDAKFDQFDSATYLFSKKGSANIGYVYGSNVAQQVNKNSGTGYVEPSGLDRRVIAIDETGNAAMSTPEARYNRGIVELYKKNTTALFDGELAKQVDLGYNRDFALGDIVTLSGEYGIKRFVRIAEWIRTEDDTGEKAYPGFEAVEEFLEAEG